MINISERNITKHNTFEFKTVEDIVELIEFPEFEADDLGEGAALSFDLEDYNDEGLPEKIKQVAKVFLDKGFIPDIWIDGDVKHFTVSEFEKLIDIEEAVKGDGIDFFISENELLFTLNETLMAYQKAREYTEFVKKSGASPFEMYLMIYGYIASFAYKENEENFWTSRGMISVLSGDDIVCVGYAELLLFMLEEVGIKANIQTATIEENGQTFNHMNNIVFLKDEKYKIDGVYYADCCWDAIDKGMEPYLSYLFALVPIQDVGLIMPKVSLDKDIVHLLYEANNYDEIMYNYFYESDMFGYFNPKRAEEFGFEVKPIEMTEEEFEEKLIASGKVLADIFKKHKIPADVYKTHEELPNRFDPNFLYALSMDMPHSSALLDYYMEQLKKVINGELVYSGKKKDFEEFGNKFLVDDIYLEIESFIKERGDGAINNEEIELHYIGLDAYKQLRDYLYNERAKSKAISSETWKSVLFETYKLLGMTEEEAIVMTRRAMQGNIGLSKKKFKDGAVNGFSNGN